MSPAHPYESLSFWVNNQFLEKIQKKWSKVSNFVIISRCNRRYCGDLGDMGGHYLGISIDRSTIMISTHTHRCEDGRMIAFDPCEMLRHRVVSRLAKWEHPLLGEQLMNTIIESNQSLCMRRRRGSLRNSVNLGMHSGPLWKLEMVRSRLKRPFYFSCFSYVLNLSSYDVWRRSIMYTSAEIRDDRFVSEEQEAERTEKYGKKSLVYIFRRLQRYLLSKLYSCQLHDLVICQYWVV